VPHPTVWSQYTNVADRQNIDPVAAGEPLLLTVAQKAKTLAFSYIDSVTLRHSSSGRQPNFAPFYKEWNYRTFAEVATYIRQGGGHHVGIGWHSSYQILSGY